MSYRKLKSILGDNSEQHIDADTIMVASVLGFSSLLLSKGAPVRFDMEISLTQLQSTRDASLEKLAADTQKFSTAIDKVNAALQKYNPDSAQMVKVGTTPGWKKGGLITGSPEGEGLDFDQRHIKISDAVAQEFHEIASTDDSVGYQQRGAYTGLVSDPGSNRSSIKSTARFNIPENGHGHRWIPSGGTSRSWGLIGGLESIPGMVEEPAKSGSIVGYTHGMIQAIYDCAAHGHGCTPYEIAVGNKTTKLASCFPCTLFMYAAGYPPSSIHLGRGESWVPFYPKEEGSDGYSKPIDSVITKINRDWSVECVQHLRLGVRILKPVVQDTHRESLLLLEEFLNKEHEDISFGSNLILDALTVHDSETNRILRTIK